MKALWLTDIHINFLHQEQRLRYYNLLQQKHSDCVFISGDIAEASSVNDLLREMYDKLRQPIYFVLGNHDYYSGHIDSVREQITAMTQNMPDLYWCQLGVKKLSASTALVGCDGWADGRYGDYLNSPVRLNDSRFIADYIAAEANSRSALLDKMQALADHDAMILQQQIMIALAEQSKKIIILTHVPPFKEATMHEGQQTDDDYLPFFSSKASGDVIAAAATANPDVEFLVLCGHTHSEANFQAFANCLVRAGDVVYKHPSYIDVINI